MASSVVVVVVGGGASGLTAALELKKSASAYYTSPITVLVMEASSRLGGRILPCDVPVEYESIGGGVLYERVQLGAEYVHGGEHLLDDFLSQKNIKRIPACVAAQATEDRAVSKSPKRRSRTTAEREKLSFDFNLTTLLPRNLGSPT